MLLRPKRTKFKKSFKGKVSGISSNANMLVFGKFGLRAMESNRVTEKQIEAARKSITNKMKVGGKLWIRLFPNISVTKKPIESRMGKGKGDFSHFISRVKSGRILFELDGVSKIDALLLLKRASYKLPLQTRFVGYSDIYF